MKMEKVVDSRAREPWEICSDLELQNAVMKRLRCMRSVAVSVVSLHYGLGHFDGISYSLQDISQIHKRGRSSIRQIILVAISRIAAHPGPLECHLIDRGFVSRRNH